MNRLNRKAFFALFFFLIAKAVYIVAVWTGRVTPPMPSDSLQVISIFNNGVNLRNMLHGSYPAYSLIMGLATQFTNGDGFTVFYISQFMQIILIPIALITYDKKYINYPLSFFILLLFTGNLHKLYFANHFAATFIFFIFALWKRPFSTKVFLILIPATIFAALIHRASIFYLLYFSTGMLFLSFLTKKCHNRHTFCSPVSCGLTALLTLTTYQAISWASSYSTEGVREAYSVKGSVLIFSKFNNVLGAFTSTEMLLVLSFLMIWLLAEKNRGNSWKEILTQNPFLVLSTFFVFVSSIHYEWRRSLYIFYPLASLKLGYLITKECSSTIKGKKFQIKALYLLFAGVLILGIKQHMINALFLNYDLNFPFQKINHKVISEKVPAKNYVFTPHVIQGIFKLANIKNVIVNKLNESTLQSGNVLVTLSHEELYISSHKEHPYKRLRDYLEEEELHLLQWFLHVYPPHKIFQRKNEEDWINYWQERNEFLNVKKKFSFPPVYFYEIL